MAEEKKQNRVKRSQVNIPNGEKEKYQPNFRSSIKLKYLKPAFHYIISNAIYMIITILLAAAANFSTSPVHHILQICNSHLKHNVFITISCTTLILVFATIYFMNRPRKVYLVDFACYKPDPSLLCSRKMVLEKVASVVNEENAVFTKRVLERSGLGDRIYASGLEDFPPKDRFESARKEAEMVICGAMDDLMAKTKANLRDIGIVIVNISAYNPIPSLSSMIINRYKLRGDVVSCNLGGMGCSAGVISIDLAKRLL